MKSLPSFLVKVFYAIAILIVCVNIASCESNAEHKVIETNNGKVRGVRQTTLIKNVEFYAFKGIPYAKPPIGALRFKAPEPVDWSSTIIDAFEHGPISPQLPELSYRVDDPQSEDCLFLNVYVPADVKNEKLAVMVFIHGGGYIIGSGNDDWHGPDFLIEQNVIFVTINYRLGVFGFLSLGLPAYSGNMALKDQQLALKWIHSNIEYFSGDNTRITLFGQSAGGASVHFHILSSESRQNFRNAILMSGTVDDVWAMSEESDHLTLARKIATDLGASKDKPEELIEFLKMAPTEKLVEYSSSQKFGTRTFKSILAPIIERYDAVQPIIVESPCKIYNENKIEIDSLFTFTSSECILSYFPQNVEIMDLKGLDEHFNLTLPFKGVNLTFDSPEYQKIAKEIRDSYFGDAAIDEMTLKQYIDLLSDVNFIYGVDKAAKRHAYKTDSKTYYLRFSVDSKLNVLKHHTAAGHLPGTAHAEDLAYLLRSKAAQPIYDDILKNKDDEQSKICLQTIEKFTKIFTNFAKYGKPTHDGDPIDQFLPIQGDQVNFVDITNNGFVPGVNPNQKRNELWSKIEQEVNKHL